MAFMMPVMKNDWDIYKSNRSRKTSENTRSRKVSESKSESLGHASPVTGSLGASPAHRSVPSMMGVPQRAMRPPRPARSLSCSPPAPPQEKFHTRLVDKLRRTLLRKDKSVAADDERSS
ncbi:uncharacterized protein LOC143909558 [Arctopsyche grandis]|uniref:uncharacterized protein LOC143909558 n=1 Tax=Arctopsyche grandis TaxID=121162 RepID=UPI00406D959D